VVLLIEDAQEAMENKLLYIMETLTHYVDFETTIHSLGYLIVSLLLFIVGKLLFKVTNKDMVINHEVVEKDNLAFIVSYVGYFVAIVIILIASISGKSHGFITDIGYIVTYSSLGMLLLQVSVRFTNKLVLPKFCIKKEIIEDQNVGTGLIEAAVYIGNGLILYSSLVGESESFLEGLFTFIVYWAIGNVMLIISSIFFLKWTPYDIHDEIEKDNVAAGTAFSGAIIAICIVILNALIDPFDTWLTTFMDLGVYGIVGILLLPLVRKSCDKILLVERSLTQEICQQEVPNLGAGLLEAFSYIGSAILITWTF